MHKRIIPALALATVAALAGCNSSSGGGATGHATTATTATAAAPSAAATLAGGLNPVDLIRKAGGQPMTGQTGSNTDARGNRYATGGIGSDIAHIQAIRITTKTASSTPWPQEPSTADDWFITGPGFVADLSGDAPVSPQTVAQRLGGTVVPRG